MSNPYGNQPLLQNGDILTTNSGDIYTIADYEKKNSATLPFEGYYNILVSLTNRLLTVRGDNVFYPDYGSNIPLMLSQPNSANFATKLQVEAEESLLQDPRVDSVENVKVEQNGNKVQLFAEIKLKGKSEAVDFVFPHFIVE